MVLACRLWPLCLWFGFICLLHCFQNTSCALVYHRLTLISIRASMKKLLIFELGKSSKSLPPFLAAVPPYLCRSSCGLPRRKGCRRGKRGGVLVRLKAYLGRCPVSDLYLSNSWYNLSCDCPFMLRVRRDCYRWFRPWLYWSTCLLFTDIGFSDVLWGVAWANLCPLYQASHLPTRRSTLRMALINARDR